MNFQDFNIEGSPGGPVVKNLFSPWAGKIPHSPGQVSLRAAVTEAHTLGPMLHNKRSHCSKKPAHASQLQSGLHLLQLEKANAQQQRPSTAADKKK